MVFVHFEQRWWRKPKWKENKINTNFKIIIDVTFKIIFTLSQKLYSHIRRGFGFSVMPSNLHLCFIKLIFIQLLNVKIIIIKNGIIKIGWTSWALKVQSKHSSIWSICKSKRIYCSIWMVLEMRLKCKWRAHTSNELGGKLKCTFLTGRWKKLSRTHTHAASSWSGNQKWIRRLCIQMAWHFYYYFPLIGIWYAAYVNLMRWKSSAISNFYTNASTVCIFDFFFSLFRFGGEATITSTQKWNNVKCDWSIFFSFISPLNPTKSNTRFFSRLL